MPVAKIKSSPAIQAMIKAAAEAGLPRDQVERFVKAGYVPLSEPDGGMLPFHAAARRADRTGGPEWLALGGKRGPGKSHTVMAQILDDITRCPNLKVLFLRKIKGSAKESLEDVIRRVFKYTPHDPTNSGLVLGNGSRVVIGGYKDANDIDKYLGVEYDIIVVEECTQLTEDKITKLRGSLRSSNVNWRPRLYLTTNADGVGLAWFKTMIIEPHRKGKETDTFFLDVTGIHNPFINDEYNAWLDKLKGAIRKAWKDGDWDAFAGMAFPMWNEELHVIKPFEIPLEWPRVRAIDDGTAAPWCCLWIAKDPVTRRQYVYREAYQAELTTDQQIDRIHDMTLPSETFQFNYADPALWQRKTYKDKIYSVADNYRDRNIYLTRADNDRIAGKRKVDNVLSIQPDGLPGLQIFETCTHTIEQLATLARDKNNPEDVDTTAEDHAYDPLRYSQTNVGAIQQPLPPTSREYQHPAAALKGL